MIPVKASVKMNGHFTLPVLHSANLVDHNFLSGAFLAGNNGETNLQHSIGIFSRNVALGFKKTLLQHRHHHRRKPVGPKLIFFTRWVQSICGQQAAVG